MVVKDMELVDFLEILAESANIKEVTYLFALQPELVKNFFSNNDSNGLKNHLGNKEVFPDRSTIFQT